MLRGANNKFFSALGTNSLTSALPAAGTVITPANLPSGAIVITDLGLRRLDDSTAGADLSAMGTTEQFIIVQGLGASKPLLKSEVITIGNTTITHRSHVISCQQVNTIGYNRAAATGSLPAANDTSYFVKIRKNDNDAGNRSQPFSLFGQFKTDSSATQNEVAFGLAANLTKNMEDEPANNYMKGEVVGDGTVAVHTGTSTISLFTKGSKKVSVWVKAAAGDDTLTASTATVTTADVINVPSSGGKSFTFTAEDLGAGAGRHVIYLAGTTYDVADAGTVTQNGAAIETAINLGTQASCTAAVGVVTITLKPGTIGFPMVIASDDDTTFTEITTLAIASGDINEVKYAVEATTVAAATYTLTTAYQGATGYFYEGTAVQTNTGIATVTNYGVKLTGIQADFDVNKFRNYYANRFTATFSDEGTLITSVQGARNGSGMWQQAAMDEYMTWGFEGQNEMLGTPPTLRDQYVIENAEYSIVNISWTETVTGLVGMSGASGSVQIYCQLDGDSTLPATNVSGEVADVLGEIASPIFASTDLNK